MENIDQKTLFVAFTPGQAADLVEGRSVFPQETSERFALLIERPKPTTSTNIMSTKILQHKIRPHHDGRCCSSCPLLSSVAFSSCGHQSRGNFSEEIRHCHHTFECWRVSLQDGRRSPFEDKVGQGVLYMDRQKNQPLCLIDWTSRKVIACKTLETLI